MEKEEKRDCAGEFELTVDGCVLTLMVDFPFYSPLTRQRVDRAHTHSVYELFYATEGGLVLHTEEGEHSITKGHLLFVAPSRVHYVTQEHNTRQYVFKFSVEDTHKCKDSKSFEVLSFESYRTVEASAEVAALIPIIDKAVTDCQPHAATALLYALLSLLSQKDQKKQSDLSVLADNKAKRVYFLEELLNQYYDSNCTIGHLAKKLHLSERQVSRLVKKEYGKSFRSRLSAVRMEAAKRFLSEGYPIAEVSEMVGYSSISAFYTAYKRHYGVPPGKSKQ